jgi:ATP-dependent DNA helicase RecG
MAAIESVSDGFELAEIDLELRGEGDLLGDRQSGLAGRLSASVVADREILEQARADVADLLKAAGGLSADPMLVPVRRAALQRFPGVGEGRTAVG